MVQHILHRLKISCLPKDIPEKVEVNITELAINHSVHVRDLNIPNVTLLDHADNAVVSVLPPTVAKEAEVVAVAEEAVKEPEVVGKGKKPEEGESAEPAKGDAKGAPKDAKPASKDPKPASKDAKPAPKEEKKK
jgi:large subunit ribosomal protein L25